MCFYIPRHPMIPTACFLAFVGDIILIWNKKKQMFALGAMFFFASHVLNFFSLKKLFSFKIPVYVYIIIPIMMVLAGVILFFIKKKDWISFLVGVFGLAHSINLILSIILIIDGTVVPGILVSLGYVLCISSDLILERVTFKKDIRRRDFPIMLTYLLGQALTYFGLAMASLLL